MTLRVPIEPLDDDRVARIERAIVTALPARSAAPVRWRAPFGFALAAAAAALIAWRALVPAHPEARVDAPIAVEAAPAGTRVDLDGAVITTGAGAAFTVTRPDGGLAIDLAHGELELSVTHREDRLLVVHAGDVDVVDVGTVFSVARTPHDGGDDDVDVAVREGVVQVRHAGVITTLAAGQSWSRREKIAEITPPPPPAVDTGTGATPAAHPTGSHPPRSKPPLVKPATSGSPLEDLHTAIDAQPIARASVVGTIADYRRMASQEKGAAAATGLYGLAVAQHEAGDDGDAVRSLSQYVDRFQETEPVLWLRIVVLCKGALTDSCRQAAHTYRGFVSGDSERVQLAERVINSP